ncbi:MAG: succinate dehydrogenase iron-sulfur subunit [Chloroflexi bacterium]|nr:succinate dehydrogenase iron-sulfur subunit [Chloroflexota bacterium]
MLVKYNVKRFNPEVDRARPYYQEYEVELSESNTVLDGLIKIREEVDGSLTLRCSCRSAICGSCGMRINGGAGLACNTKLVEAVRDGAPILVEPMGNMPVIKDLVTEMNVHWDKVRAIKPYLQPEGPVPEREYIAPNEDMLHLAGVMSCIMCGSCVSDCTALEVDKNFLGPAALAKAYRFVADPRDAADNARLRELNEYGGIWDCTRCMKCVEVCPKNVDPMGRIMALRAKAIEAGYTNTYGARHAMAFSEIIEHSGTLDELRLPIKTFGIFNVKEMFKLLPTGIRAQLAGKRPPIFHKTIPGISNVRRIFQKVESRK